MTNVVNLDMQRPEENKSVYNDILYFLKDIDTNNGITDENKKSNTRRNYELIYIDFFKYTRGKTLNELIKQDLIFDKSDVIRYREYLKTKYAPASINQKINALRSLFRNAFFDNGYINNIELASFKVKNLKITENNSKIRGWYTLEEWKEMRELVKSEEKGEVKSLLFELAGKSGFRLEACLDLTWNNFYIENDIVMIKIEDKGKLHIKPIKKEFYDRLLTLKTEKEDKVFKISIKTVNKSLKGLAKKMGLDPRRNLSFHSFKKFSMDEVNLISGGDINAIAEQGNESPITALKHYVELRRDPRKMLCLQIGEEPDINALEQLTRDELLDLIKKDRGIQIKLLALMGKID